MLQIIFQKLELEIIGKPVRGPRLGIGLIAAHYQAAHFLFPIGETIGIAQRRHARCHAVDAFGDEILVLHRYERNVNPGHTPDLARPLPATDDEFIAGHAAPIGGDRTHAAILDVDPRDLHSFGNGDASLARSFGERHRDVSRRHLSVHRKEGGADHVVDLHERPQILGLLGVEEMHLEPE